MKNALILLAGGVGERLASKEPKQFSKIGSTNLIEYFLNKLDSRLFNIIIIATKSEFRKKYLTSIKKKFNQHNLEFSISGSTRQITSKKSLNFLKKYNPENVLIHDSARPLASNLLIKKIINCLDKHDSCIPFIFHNDFIKSKKGKIFNAKDIINIQTPQGFNFKKIYKAHKSSTKIDAKDDSSVFELQNKKLKMIRGDIINIKITTKNDLEYFNRLKLKEFRSGIGYDVHPINFNSNKKLTLCGVKISHPPLIGYSDADVGYHAVCDSILGSLSMKDIGFHFNNKNKKWKNSDSKIFIKFCARKLILAGFKITNLDINFICETPNISKLRNLMKKNLSMLLNVSTKNISIKATTNEKIGFIGKGEAIAAESIVQITNE